MREVFGEPGTFPVCEDATVCTIGSGDLDRGKR